MYHDKSSNFEATPTKRSVEIDHFSNKFIDVLTQFTESYGFIALTATRMKKNPLPSNETGKIISIKSLILKFRKTTNEI